MPLEYRAQVFLECRLPYTPSLEHVHDGSAIPEHGKRHSKNTRVQYSNGIESKYKFEYKIWPQK